MRNRKIAVEECLSLDVYVLARRGAFEVRVGTRSDCVWRDSSGWEIFRLDFWLEGASPVRYLRLEYRSTASAPAPTSCRIELESVPSNLGGTKRFFLCPGKANRGPCGRRAQKLYLVEGKWVCQTCGDLTYLARRQHDSRKDALLRDPDALLATLKSKNVRRSLLAVGAYAQAVARLRKYIR